MKPYLEPVAVADGASWSMVRVPRDPIPFEWHHHPEYELTLTGNSRGHRFIGDHVGPYDDGDLVLIGPNVPHTWASTSPVEADRPHLVMCLKFHPEWVHGLTGVLTELRPIGALLARSARGLAFSPPAAQGVRHRIERLFGQPPAERVLNLLSVLLALAADDEAEPLAAPRLAPETAPDAQDRFHRVLEHLHTCYRDEVAVEALAQVAALSPSAFHRMFLRRTRMTLGEYVVRLRIGEACSQLIAGDRPVAVIADSVGYRSLANFGRQFKALKGETPRAYRQRFR